MAAAVLWAAVGSALLVAVPGEEERPGGESGMTGGCWIFLVCCFPRGSLGFIFDLSRMAALLVRQGVLRKVLL